MDFRTYIETYHPDHKRWVMKTKIFAWTLASVFSFLHLYTGYFGFACGAFCVLTLVTAYIRIDEREDYYMHEYEIYLKEILKK